MIIIHCMLLHIVHTNIPIIIKIEHAKMYL